MATAVGALSIDLSLNSAAFIRDVGKSQKALASNSARMNKALGKLDRGFTKVLRSVKRMGKSMISMRSVIATVAGGAGIGLLIKTSLNYADTLVKTADKIGFTTDALQELRFASDQAGVSQQTLDLALQRFSRRVGEAVQGSGELKDTLIQLGIAVTDSSGRARSADDVLRDLSNAMGRTASAGGRLRIAFKAFDSEGAALVNLFGRGADAADKLRQKARDLGIVMDEKLVRAAARAKGELDALASIIKIKVIGAVVEFAPEIENLATAFADLIPGIIKTAKVVGRFFGVIDKSQSEKVKAIAGEINTLTVKISDLNEEMAATQASPFTIILGTDKIKNAEKEIADLEKRVVALREKLQVAINAPDIGALPAPQKPPTGAPGPGPAKVKLIKFPGREDVIGSVRGLEQAARANRDLLSAELNAAEAIRLTTIEMNRQADQTLVLTTATVQVTLSPFFIVSTAPVKGSLVSCLMPRLMRSLSVSVSRTLNLTTSPLV